MKYFFLLIFVNLNLNVWARVFSELEVKSMKPVFQHVREQIAEHKAEQILVVFDIDNTLLTANQDFGSLGWDMWQQQQVIESGKHAVTDSLEKLFAIENVLFTLGRMSPPEAFIPHQIKALQNIGVRVIALTSRGPAMRSATEREMMRNGYDLNALPIHAGFPGSYIPEVDKKRSVSFQNSIYMTSGQHKGLMLRHLMKKTNTDFSSIVFVDDQKKHATQMLETFEGSSKDVLVFRYGNLDEQVNNFLSGNKDQVIQDWKDLKAVWSRVFK